MNDLLSARFWDGKGFASLAVEKTDGSLGFGYHLRLIISDEAEHWRGDGRSDKLPVFKRANMEPSSRFSHKVTPPIQRD